MQEMALTLTNSGKLFARVEFLQEFCLFSKIFATVVIQVERISLTMFFFVIALKVLVFLYQNLNGIFQSTQNQPVIIRSENDRNALIQKDELQ